ncbi:hypothetical protein QE429_003421 [Bacillus sp. SORGH_AS 510]|uniref:hypothetical protein n=1 Tax=Bacillus sp. SORGH_AS_0510 TaxID=3041771 RepID=UPI0027896C46|nr:hypothetical protein [Bacillus sp. SORGH_AS_0510]MDQ1146594.1 hypothetical protein [Bacillus sp. SORGH_AS_0510]
MSNLIDLTGKTFGRLTVFKRSEGKNDSRESFWECNCKCGTKGKIVSGYYLRNGAIKSCGCLREERKKNLLGQTFTRLTVIKKAESTSKKKESLWECNCSCGKKGIIVRGSDLLRIDGKGKKSCGCLREERKQNLIGQTFERLTVVKKSEKTDKKGSIYWICDCSCGTKGHVVRGYDLLRKKGYRTLSCGCYKLEGKHTNLQEDRETLLIRYLYNKLKIRNRKKKFLDQIISQICFSKLIMEPCYYCGLSKSNVTYDKDYKKKKVKDVRTDFVLYHNGIDRIDSSKGYVNGNVVPCCKYCNMAKGDRMNDEFFDWVEKVYNHYVLPQDLNNQ